MNPNKLLKNQLVLIADDNKSTRILLRRILEQDGYTVIETQNGLEAINAFINFKPDLILLDILMPVMDGFETCTKLKLLPEANRVPVLIITDLNDNFSIEKAFLAGASEYIVKPIHSAVLRNRVKYLLHTKQIEDNLIAREKQLRDITSALGEGVFVVDNNGFIIFFNPEAENLLGWLHEDVLEKEVHQVIQLITNNGSVLSHKECPIYKTIFSGKPYSTEDYLLMRKDKTIFPSNIVTTPIKENDQVVGAVVAFRDISERKEAEEALRLSAELFSKAFNNSPCLMAIITQSDGRYITVNKAFPNITGYSYEEIINHTSVELNLWARPCDFTKISNLLSEKGVIYNQEVEWQLKSGELRKGLFSAEKININGKQCIMTVFNDITEIKRYEREITRLDQLNLVGEIAAGIAHEIRNPMTTVRGFLQIFSGKEEYANNKEHFKLMIKELDRANAIITEFLSLAKNKVLNLKMINLSTLIKGIYPLIQGDAARTEKYIHMELQDVPDLLIDEEEIRQMMLNLVLNGLQSMSPGQNLFIRLFQEENEVVLAVQDEGHGIPSNILDKVGIPFFTTKDHGTGLGLATCYSIATRHNATISFQSKDTGTTFFVKFKIKTF
ncbi:multi-sensor signal transduction histidine kinase [Desulfofarcimen acetoxidans DSM 771]|uniref:Stage 0 sporulation protein A homolog n=1 Tax=Desulfofarcimen acetoxidans (strain ATCC 49208 / DSM 771 / KCTC 5769 / VKM B-1644 / 5575) TaxID=485916 RepID=C8W024_DESAS|nr:PAS domain S-box protein [Desulfofarcimen acetoxidans]ACV64992.1 multi-sensor signal transduction histidine kinase [Desulfofarcimen acetoxidans DSM 771]